ncbi:hypothetical protein [Vibrio owensii]|uniref:hypothetical protein n=1 Tax=Vibrio owensii TaxID=696485 RepID=UPI00215B9C52|nr:hypothetical protein [Vibrio owensii]MCR9943804.1 hypothetical protein [Vibrio owensii]
MLEVTNPKTIEKTADKVLIKHRAAAKYVNEIRSLKAKYNIKSLVAFCIGKEKVSTTFIPEVDKEQFDFVRKTLIEIQNKNHLFRNDKKVNEIINVIAKINNSFNSLNNNSNFKEATSLTLSISSKSAYVEQFNSQVEAFKDLQIKNLITYEGETGRKVPTNAIHYIYERLIELDKSFKETNFGEIINSNEIDGLNIYIRYIDTYKEEAKTLRPEIKKTVSWKTQEDIEKAIAEKIEKENPELYQNYINATTKRFKGFTNQQIEAVHGRVCAMYKELKI